MNGIYCYKDTYKDNTIIYIGKDSHIEKNRRHHNHHQPSHYHRQPINRILQNNPHRYKYEILKQWESNEYNTCLSNALEIIYIRRYQPRFNYTIGGEGTKGYKHNKHTRKRISESLKGKPKKITTRKRISESLKGRRFTTEHREKLRQATREYMSKPEHRKNISKKMSKENNHQWKTYPRIIKDGHKKGKQNYCIRYNGKRIMSSTNYNKLQEKLEEIKRL